MNEEVVEMSVEADEEKSHHDKNKMMPKKANQKMIL